MDFSLNVRMERTHSGVRKIAAIVTEALKDCLEDVTGGAIELALAEACTNAVRHGQTVVESTEADWIRVEATLQSGILELAVENPGKPFDFDAVEAPVFDPEAIETLPTGGMGITLMRDIMDSVDCAAEEGTNTVRMRKTLNNTASLTSQDTTAPETIEDAR